MPDFIAILGASTLFCATVIVMNGLTRLAIQFNCATGDLAENGLAQFGVAIAIAGLALQRSFRRKGLEGPLSGPGENRRT